MGDGNDITCVFEGLGGAGAIYISNILAAQNSHILQQLNIKAIITANKGASLSHPKQVIRHYLYIPAYDSPSQDISKYFAETFKFIDQVRRTTNILVHCHAGISRSATIVIAYLLRKYNYSLKEILSMIKRKRSKVFPNQGFLEQLRKEAFKLGCPSTSPYQELIQVLTNNPVKKSTHKRSNTILSQKSVEIYSQTKSIQNPLAEMKNECKQISGKNIGSGEYIEKGDDLLKDREGKSLIRKKTDEKIEKMKQKILRSEQKRRNSSSTKYIKNKDKGKIRISDYKNQNMENLSKFLSQRIGF